MNGQIIPDTVFDHKPVWKNFFENRALVQFDHRTMAYITQSVSLYLIYTIFKYKMPLPVTSAGILVFSLINYQAVSGILTLLALVPKEKANMHQMTGLLTLSSALLMVYLTKIPLAAVVV
jgi:cytochrome c oxidase assembly protein subunit 15